MANPASTSSPFSITLPHTFQEDDVVLDRLSSASQSKIYPSKCSRTEIPLRRILLVTSVMIWTLVMENGIHHRSNNKYSNPNLLKCPLCWMMNLPSLCYQQTSWKLIWVMWLTGMKKLKMKARLQKKRKPMLVSAVTVVTKKTRIVEPPRGGRTKVFLPLKPTTPPHHRQARFYLIASP
ncbi:hypothetical protein BC943DRAFT_350801 [Umbelopsis sp. AD052]|nr:hypothetical protein BC943DRAFT_350801 [Umbelopsis sp. AD052]